MEDDDDLPEGETVAMDDDAAPDVEDTDDGGAIVTLDDDDEDAPKKGDSDFYANLAEDMGDSDLKKIASTYLELLSRDKEARKKRDEQYEEGIRRTGLGDDAPGGAQFQGASKVVHPMLTEVCVDFSSRAIKELFPPNGPVKDNIVGKLTKERVAKAGRVTDFMNWQLTVQSQSFRSELEQLLTQVPLGGAQYMKVTWNEPKNRPDFLFVAIDDIYLPYAATNFYSAQRKTHVQYLTTLDYEQRVASGMYRDVDLIPSGEAPVGSEAEQANNKIEGRDETSYNEDGLRTVFEIYAIADVEEDVGAAPYIITVDKSSSQVLSIYRNWDEDDDAKEEQQWIVEFPFVPWRGAYPIGIVHMIGGLSAAATGALRALMDSAHISNSQTMLKLKGGSRGGQSLNIQPTQVEEIEGGLNVDDVRKIAMPLPFNPPSAVLYQLLGFVVDAGKGVVRTTMDEVSESNQNVPVGTTLAKIEQGMVVFSAIHARLHAAMGRMLRILHRLNGMYLDDEMEEAELGEEIAKRADFTGPMDVVPVSDPNIFSEAQRFAQVQAVAQRSQMFPQLYDLRKVEERILDTLKIPDGLALLAPRLTPTEENAVSENVKATLGRPVVAFPDQDHVAHLKTHLAYMMSPALGMSRLIAPAYLPVMLNHIKEHVAFWYAEEVFREADSHVDFDLQEAMKELKDKDTKQAFDQMLAEASLNVSLEAEKAFASLPPIIEQAIAAIQSIQPPTPPDPATQAALADVQMRGQVAQAKAQLDAQKLQLSAQQQQGVAAREQAKMQGDMQLQQMREQEDDQRAAAEIEAKIAMNDADNQTAKELAMMEMAQGNPGAPSINPNPGL
jgi:chaperonin GroES